MVVNPVGAVPLLDGGVPNTITVTAGIGVTGGQLVFFSGANNAVSSGADSYVSNDARVAGAASGILFNGIVLTPGNTASGTNNYVTVARNGTYIVTSAGTIIAGDPVYANGADAVIGLTNTGTVIAGSYIPIGRAITAAGSEGYVVVSLGQNA